jgi:FkbM family methyltransferase
MLKDWNRGRFTLVQMIVASVLCVGVAGLGAGFAARYRYRARSAPIIEYPAHPESQALKEKYGPHRNSYSEEEWCIRDFFNDKRDGFFVDVGANDYKVTSNTYYLDTVLNWRGLAIEPQRQFEADYIKFRPRTKFLSFFVSDASNQLAKLYVLKKNSLIASGTRDFTEREGEKAKEVDVPTITLNDLLNSEGVKKIDFISIDIELWEPKALAGFDVERFRPELVCIEAHPQVRQQIIDYFARHHYVVVGKYLRADVNNLYFTPLS